MKKVLVLALTVMLMSLTASAAMASTAATVPLKLIANPTTGYDWVCTVSQEGTIKLADGEYTLGDANIVGSAGYYGYTIVGQKEGDGVLTCAYMQNSDAATTVMTVTYTVHVDANLNATIVDSSVNPLNF